MAAQIAAAAGFVVGALGDGGVAAQGSSSVDRRRCRVHHGCCAVRAGRCGMCFSGPKCKVMYTIAMAEYGYGERSCVQRQQRQGNIAGEPAQRNTYGWQHSYKLSYKLSHPPRWYNIFMSSPGAVRQGRWFRRIGTVAAVGLFALAACRSNNTNPGSAPRSSITVGGAYHVSYQPTPDPIPLNEHFAVDLIVSTATGAEVTSGTEIRVDGWMPAHGHGMHVAPQVRQTAPGRYRAEGILFHMPGDWLLRVDVIAEGTVARAEFPVRLDPG